MFRFIMTNVVLLALALFLAWHFTMLTIYGRIVIEERNTLIAASELAANLGIISFAIYNLVKGR